MVIENLTPEEIRDLKYRLQLWNRSDEDICKRKNYVPIPIERECINKYTYIMHKDISYLSDYHLVFLSDSTGLYAFDRHDDVPELLKIGYNPFTKLKFSEFNFNLLQSSLNSEYPDIYVDELPEEINNIFNNKEVYTFQHYENKMYELIDLTKDLGLEYELDNIYNFAKTLTIQNYSLYLRYKPINQQILMDLPREEAAFQTLNYIISYIQENPENIVRQNVLLSISDFLEFINNYEDYQDFVEDRMEKDLDIYWIPDFYEYEYYENGNIKSIYRFGEYNSGVYTTFYENGVKESEVLYQNGQRNGISFTWYSSLK